MKHLFIMFFVFFLFSCKNEDKATVGSIYPEEAAAIAKDGEIRLLDEAELQKSWEKRLEGMKLTAFEVIKGKTEGEDGEDYYMVLARTEDGIKVAALLEMRGDKFYFDASGQKDSESYLLVVCKGECDQGCLPAVKLAEGAKRIICSSCADCSKNEVEVF